VKTRHIYEQKQKEWATFFQSWSETYARSYFDGRPADNKRG
jgi:hypothetical protein